MKPNLLASLALVMFCTGCVATTPSAETPQLTQAQIHTQEEAREENTRRANEAFKQQVANQRAQQQAFIRQTQAKHAATPPPPRRPAPISIPSPKKF